MNEEILRLVLVLIFGTRLSIMPTARSTNRRQRIVAFRFARKLG
jgi:hypothetical protein